VKKTKESSRDRIPVKASRSADSVGQVVKFTATVSSPTTPAGTVALSDSSSPLHICRGIVLTVNAPHTATCTVSYTTVGTYSITASYGGLTSSSVDVT